MKPPLTSHTHPSIVSRNYVLPYVATCGNVIKCPQNTCHMAINMLQLPYGNERETNDGRRVTSASQRAWMEPLQAQAPRTGILLCSKVEARRNLHHFTNQVANPHHRGSTEENTGFLRGKENEITLSVAERMPNCFQHLSIHSCLSYRWEPLVQSHFVLFYPCQEGKSRTSGDRREYTNAIYGSEAAVV
jgi:hypothetical protein